jgi:SAM-dependent methyltransferase
MQGPVAGQFFQAGAESSIMRRIVSPFMLAALVVAGDVTRPGDPVAAIRTNIAYQDVKPILAVLHDSLPEELKGQSAAELERAWPVWVSRRDTEIRARLDRGGEDSILNFLLFGTSFTRLPRALNDSAKLGGQARAAEIVRRRIDELADGIGAPGKNERLQFARLLVERAGIDPTTSDGRGQVRLYLRRLMTRVVGEVQQYARDVDSARSLNDPIAEFIERSKLFRTRGLSSDTSILPDFAVEETLGAMMADGALRGGVRRVAIVGPGLDFTDKAEGYDFYPQQTMQPFALIDSLLRRGLATPDALQVTTFDLSPRINAHLGAARQRASAGGAYTLELVRDPDVVWRPGLADYWRRFGDRIGQSAKGTPPPAGAGRVEARAVRVRPDVVLSIVPQDLNIVLQRLEPLPDDEQFDLIVATNIFVYYDAFEQALGLMNAASMLRPGGFLISNNAVPGRLVASVKPAGSNTVIYTDRPGNSDQFVWYQRQ